MHYLFHHEHSIWEIRAQWSSNQGTTTRLLPQPNAVHAQRSKHPSVAARATGSRPGQIAEANALADPLDRSHHPDALRVLTPRALAISRGWVTVSGRSGVLNLGSAQTGETPHELARKRTRSSNR